MTAPPVPFPPPAWSNQDITLYHGTIATYAASIRASGIVSSRGRPLTDFGPGFYTTTLERQARNWAAQLSARRGIAPAVLQIVVPRDALAGLETLAFVRGDFDALDYWSFVHYCRRGATDHGRPPVPPSTSPSRYYDAVYGPVAAFWNQRTIIADADQVSFHTAAADAILNAKGTITEVT